MAKLLVAVAAHSHFVAFIFLLLLPLVRARSTMALPPVELILGSSRDVVLSDFRAEATRATGNLPLSLLGNADLDRVCSGAMRPNPSWLTANLCNSFRQVIHNRLAPALLPTMLQPIMNNLGDGIS
jgi:hypothetical protein